MKKNDGDINLVPKLQPKPLNVNIGKDRKKYLEQYFTEKGIDALHKRLNNLVKFYLKKDLKFPLKVKMVGFTSLQIHSKEHLQGMIDELTQLLGKKQNIIEVK